MGLLQPHERHGRRPRQAGMKSADDGESRRRPRPGPGGSGACRRCRPEAAHRDLERRLTQQHRAGVGWFAAVARAGAGGGAHEAKAAFVLDCADRADLVQDAFREGLAEACFTGRPRWRRRLRRHRAQLQGAAASRSALAPWISPARGYRGGAGGDFCRRQLKSGRLGYRKGPFRRPGHRPIKGTSAMKMSTSARQGDPRPITRATIPAPRRISPAS